MEEGFGSVRFGSVRDLYEKARKVDLGIALNMVSKWMRAQPNRQTRNYIELQFLHSTVSEI